MKVILFGATGMVGAGVLRECLDDPQVASILVVGRSSCAVSDAKITEILHRDFFDYTTLQAQFANYDACFFCLGVSSAGMSEEKYHHLTYELTLAAATSMVAVNSELTFCYVSGMGTDSTERSRTMWTRVKGKTENALLALPFAAAYMFRPGYIQPLKGVRSKTWIYQIVYDVFGALYPMLRRVFPSYVTTTVNIGLAMIEVATRGCPQRILLPVDINRLASEKIAKVTRG